MDEDTEEGIKVILNLINGFSDFKYFDSHFNIQIIKNAYNKKKKNAAIINILKWMININIPDSILFPAALYILFTPDMIDLNKDSKEIETIVLYLKKIFEKMYSETDDHRKIFAALALLELGVDQKWESIVLGFYDKEDWYSWPVLKKMGMKVLQYLDEKKKIPIHIALLKDTECNYEKLLIIKKIISIDVKAGIKLFEDRIFTLDLYEEAILYSKVGIKRNYDYMLKNAIKIGTTDLYEYLGDLGGAEAIPVLKEAKDKHVAPEEQINEALKKIRTRIKE